MRLNLRALRVLMRLTQGDTASELKTSVSRYSRIELGETVIRPEEAEVLARLFGVAPELILPSTSQDLRAGRTAGATRRSH